MTRQSKPDQSPGARVSASERSELEALRALVPVWRGALGRIEAWANTGWSDHEWGDEPTDAERLENIAATAKAALALPAVPGGCLEDQERLAPSSLHVDASGVGANLLKRAQRLVDIVEGIGVLDHGCWRNEHGTRLKDAQSWVAFYTAVKDAELAALSAPLPAALSECWNCGAFTSARDAADRPYCNGLNNRAGKCRAQGSRARHSRAGMVARAFQSAARRPVRSTPPGYAVTAFWGGRDVSRLAIIERRVIRYSCPHCSRSRSKRQAVADHMFSCWKNPAARSCGSCEHHLPAEKGESAEWSSGYPGSPGHPRACDLGIDNAEAMPRQCVAWAAAISEPQTGASSARQRPVEEADHDPSLTTGIEE